MSLVSTLAALLVPWRSMFAMHGWMMQPFAESGPRTDLHTFMQPFDIFFSPWWWGIMLLGWAVYGFSVWFAYLDHRELRNRGIDRPFPWPWMFLSLVYPIGRIVVTIRRTGTGWGPLWGLIATQVVGIIVAVVISAQITLATFATAFWSSSDRGWPSLGEDGYGRRPAGAQCSDAHLWKSLQPWRKKSPAGRRLCTWSLSLTRSKSSAQQVWHFAPQTHSSTKTC